MRKTVLNRTTILVILLFTLAPVFFAGARYFTEGSQSLRAQQELTEDHHDEEENHHEE